LSKTTALRCKQPSGIRVILSGWWAIELERSTWSLFSFRLSFISNGKLLLFYLPARTPFPCALCVFAESRLLLFWQFNGAGFASAHPDSGLSGLAGVAIEGAISPNSASGKAVAADGSS
jgi:hypothetical protein